MTAQDRGDRRTATALMIVLFIVLIRNKLRTQRGTTNLDGALDLDAVAFLVLADLGDDLDLHARRNNSKISQLFPRRWRGLHTRACASDTSSAR